MNYYGITDIGLQRKENQDKIYFPSNEDDIKLFIIADGMGGANAGKVASSLAIDFAKNFIMAGFDDAKDDKEKLQQLIRDAIVEANSHVYKKSLEKEELSGMGTTLSIALIIRNKVYIGHVGDSRIYRIRKNIIRQLTQDHSYVHDLYKKGIITKAEAENHPQKNMLIKVVGCQDFVEPDVFIRGFLPNDYLLICSDGLTNMVSTNEIYNEVVSGKSSLESTCNNLISHSKSSGGYDNISVILIFND